MALPRLYSAHGRSGSAASFVTRSTERMTSSLPKASRQLASSVTPTASSGLGPLAASEVADSQEGTPIVGGAVVERLRYLRVGVDELLEVVGRPARGLAPQSLEPFVIPPTQPLDLCPRRLAL